MAGGWITERTKIFGAFRVDTMLKAGMASRSFRWGITLLSKYSVIAGKAAFVFGILASSFAGAAHAAPPNGSYKVTLNYQYTAVDTQRGIVMENNKTSQADFFVSISGNLVLLGDQMVNAKTKADIPSQFGGTVHQGSGKACRPSGPATVCNQVSIRGDSLSVVNSVIMDGYTVANLSYSVNFKGNCSARVTGYKHNGFRTMPVKSTYRPLASTCTRR